MSIKKENINKFIIWDLKWGNPKGKNDFTAVILNRCDWEEWLTKPTFRYLTPIEIGVYLFSSWLFLALRGKRKRKTPLWLLEGFNNLNFLVWLSRLQVSSLRAFTNFSSTSLSLTKWRWGQEVWPAKPVNLEKIQIIILTCL